MWDTVSLKSNFDLLLTGIGVFSPSTGGGEVIISVDARPLQDPLRPLDLVTCLDSIDDDEHTMTIFSKVSQNYSISLKFCEISTLNLTKYTQSSLRWRFRKILWPSQNIWTLLDNLKKDSTLYNLFANYRSALLT